MQSSYRRQQAYQPVRIQTGLKCLEEAMLKGEFLYERSVFVQDKAGRVCLLYAFTRSCNPIASLANRFIVSQVGSCFLNGILVAHLKFSNDAFEGDGFISYRGNHGEAQRK